jgi:hypothetical protein
MGTINASDVQRHVTIVGWLYIVGNALFLVIGVFVFVMVTGVGLYTNDLEARSIMLVVGPSVGLLLTMLAVPGLAAGYGLIARKPWAHMLAIALAILGLLNFPLGTAIGVYALWVLLQSTTREYFAAPLPATA